MPAMYAGLADLQQGGGERQSSQLVLQFHAGRTDWKDRSSEAGVVA